MDLFWQATQPISIPYTVFVHVLDPAGRRVGQWDQQPKSGLAPTHHWLSGEVILDRYQLTLEPGARPDHLEIGLYDARTQTRLPLTAGAPVGSTSLRIRLNDD